MGPPDQLQLLDLRNELLLRIIDSMTTTEGRGLLLGGRRLSDLARPNVPQKRQREARAAVLRLFFADDDDRRCESYLPSATKRPPLLRGASSRRLQGSWCPPRTTALCASGA